MIHQESSLNDAQPFQPVLTLSRSHSPLTLTLSPTAVHPISSTHSPTFLTSSISPFGGTWSALARMKLALGQ